MRTALVRAPKWAVPVLLVATVGLTGCVVRTDHHHHEPSPPPPPPPTVAAVTIEGVRVEFKQADHFVGAYYEDVITLYDSRPGGWRIELSTYALDYDCENSCFDYLYMRVTDPYGYVYESYDCSFDAEVCFGNVSYHPYGITDGVFGGYLIDGAGYSLLLEDGWFDAIYIGS